VSITVTPMARAILASGKPVDQALAKFVFERGRGISVTVLLAVSEAREFARIIAAVADAAEALPPIVITEPDHAPAVQPEDGGVR
jgi:hypothetical protein